MTNPTNGAPSEHQELRHSPYGPDKERSLVTVATRTILIAVALVLVALAVHFARNGLPLH